MRKSSTYEVKVGIFVTLVLVLLMLVIIALSSKSTFFEKTYLLETSFSNIGGLSEGALVRLAGVEIGYVRWIRFAEDVNKSRVYVSFSVDTEGLLRLTQDSRATIMTAGLLGNKYLELIPGDPRSGFVQEGDSIRGVDPVDFVQELQRAGEIIDHVSALAGSVREVVDSIKGDGKPTDLSKTITSIKNIIARVETGPGMAHAVIYDPKREKVVEDLGNAVHDLRMIVSEVREGKGTLNALIYGQKGAEVVQNLSAATGILEDILFEVREGHGPLHKLLYGSEREDIVDELLYTVNNLREVTQAIKDGEGTIGALIYDPSVYEDIKKITGDLSRNRALKSIIRRTLKRYSAKKEKQASEAY